jgi:hypothetical protein
VSQKGLADIGQSITATIKTTLTFEKIKIQYVYIMQKLEKNSIEELNQSETPRNIIDYEKKV